MSDYNGTVVKQFPEDRLLSFSSSNVKPVIAVGVSNKTVHVFSLKNDNLKVIRRIVSKKIANWQIQGKYEKSSNFLKRVNDTTREKQVATFTQQTIDSLAQNKKNWTINATDYDPDNESFKIPGYSSKGSM